MTVICRTVTGTEDEGELLQIGKISHHLRKLNLTFPVHAQLPLPMFILWKHKKYINAFDRCNRNYKKEDNSKK